MCSVASIAVLDCTPNLHVDLLVLWPFAKVFSMKFMGVTSFGGTSERLAEVSPRKLAPIRERFPLYSTFIPALPMRKCMQQLLV